MSKIRRRSLPFGWYPENADRARSVLEGWSTSSEPVCTDAAACVAPHAGWEFSGELAYTAIRCLKKPVDTAVVIGGHLPPVPRLLISPAELFETPFGYIEADKTVIKTLLGHFDFSEDTRADNTVEIQLPIVKYLFPDAKLVFMRISPTAEAAEVGKRLGVLSGELNRNMVVIGSTDLTHYGPAYGFTPAGAGKKAVEWVRKENDRPFLDFLLNMDLEGALLHAKKNSSACSAGAAVAAAAFAEATGINSGTLVGHRLSCDLYPGDSFVGYGAVAYVS